MTGPPLASLDTFDTERLNAERLTPAHWNDLRAMDRDALYMTHLGGVRDEAGTAAYLERNLTHWEAYGFGVWMLRDRESGEMAGRAVLRHLLVDDGDEIEVGYGFYPRWWGRGLATEIARACVRLGFDRLGRESLVAVTLPRHTDSRHVMEKVGFHYERDVRLAGTMHALFRIGSPSDTGAAG
ncbi:MAG TPA: GNAT family N-acetyltransferase [Gemmatimonadales bacterium]|nr:GNAT family N-acetyltransferase [Gemmatimonadales bacterium]